MAKSTLLVEGLLTTFRIASRVYGGVDCTEAITYRPGSNQVPYPSANNGGVRSKADIDNRLAKESEDSPTFLNWGTARGLERFIGVDPARPSG
jgi:hypothetical protein